MDFKVKCVLVRAFPEYFTEGKIYFIKDGSCVCDNGEAMEAWALPMNGKADFEAFSKWFSPWYVFELVEDKKVFTANDLKTGMFGVMTNGKKFVVVNDNLIYSDGGYDEVSYFHNDMKAVYYIIDKVYDNLCSFNQLNSAVKGNAYYGNPVYDRERDANKPLYNGKVVCINNSANPNLHTIGKIYQFKDGHLTADNGDIYPGRRNPISTFKDWEKWTSSKFIEIKE